jgi:hypothetical protein
MVIKVRSTVVLFGLCVAVARLCEAQSLSPRAYLIVPIHSNAVTVTYSLNAGGVVFNGLPITNSSGRIGSEIVSYFHTFDCFGRSANVTVFMPYVVGHLRGDVNGVEQKLYRSGLGAVAARVSVNLVGARAMNAEEYSRWRQKMVIGASLTVEAPTGQYDGTRLINVGQHRWSFKPEIGLSRRIRKHWMVDAYGAVWFFTPNDDFFSSAPGSTGPNRQTQEPMGAVEAHLSYDVKPRLWVSVDGNYWYGGKTSLNDVESPTSLQANSRLGATAAIPITRHQSLKFSYSRGAYVTFGGNFQNVSAAWQYSWMGRPN